MSDHYDAGQAKEAAYIASQSGAGVNMGAGRRWLTAAAYGTVVAVFVGAVAAAADGPWAALAAGAFLGIVVCLLPAVLAPARALSWHVRSMTPTAEAMKRGENFKIWPG